MYLAALTGSVIHVDTDAHWELLLLDAQPAGAASQQAWAAVRKALAEITFPVDLDSRRVAERLSVGNCSPIRTLLRRLAHSVSVPGTGSTPHELAKQVRQARSKVEREATPADNNNVFKARVELHVPPAGFFRHEVQRLLVMFAGATRPRTVPYALRLVFDEPEADYADASKPDDTDARAGRM